MEPRRCGDGPAGWYARRDWGQGSALRVTALRVTAGKKESAGGCQISDLQKGGSLSKFQEKELISCLIRVSQVAQCKVSTCQCAGAAGSIPGLGRSPGAGNGSPLQYSRLENFMNRGA